MFIMEKNRRFSLSTIKDGRFWADVIAEKILDKSPNEKIYTVAAGISPSGTVHFGNFRDVMVSHLVRESLKRKGKKTRLILSLDNFDRFRKVPEGVPESFEKYIGKPLTKIPSPSDNTSVSKDAPSYAEHFQKPFINAMKALDIDIEYIDQTKMYESGAYDDYMHDAILKRKEIADILLSFMTDKAKNTKGINNNEYRENFYPVSVYSRFTGKDSTKIKSYNEETRDITYFCAETRKTDVINLNDNHLVKLTWKVDWAMRWGYENVHFEPGGSDHAAPEGSYDVASVMANKIFNTTPPIFIEYMFVGIQGLGSKMSGSKGNAVSPIELLDIYEPELLKWIYSRKMPNQTFQLAFDSEIYRQYDEYDKEKSTNQSFFKKLLGQKNEISFRQTIGLGQIVQWKKDKFFEIAKELKLKFDKNVISRRLLLAKNWLTKYNTNEIIELRDSVNTEYAKTLSENQKKLIEKLYTELKVNTGESIKDLDLLVYKIPKIEGADDSDMKKSQRDFFKDVYNLLIGKETGPRLGTFLWAIDREKVLALLKI